MKSNEVTQTSHLRFSIDRAAEKAKFLTFTHTKSFLFYSTSQLTTLITRGEMIFSVHTNVNEMNVIFVVKNKATAAAARKSKRI